VISPKFTGHLGCSRWFAVAGWRQIQINQQKKEATTDTVSYRYSI
jgi:hypothetical protein